MRLSRAALGATAAVALIVATPGAASAGAAGPGGSTRLLSRSVTGRPGEAGSVQPAISRDGSVVAFASIAEDLVPGDTNRLSDVFLIDRSGAGSVVLVSHAMDGGPANGESSRVSVSGDGPYMTFLSRATNLVAEPTKGLLQVYLYDRTADTISLVSRNDDGLAGDADSVSASVSGTGAFVAFASKATNFVTDSAKRHTNVYRRDIVAATTTLISKSVLGRPANKDSFDPSIDDSGSEVAFASYASNLFHDDKTGHLDVFLSDRAAEVSLISRTPGGAPANGFNYGPSISGNGRFIAFSSDASDLAQPDTNGATDVFVRNLRTDHTRLLSTAPSGDSANSDSSAESINRRGDVVTFESYATDLVVGDVNDFADVFVRKGSGAVQLVSSGVDGAPSDGESDASAVNSSGRVIVYQSVATNLVRDDDNGAYDVFLNRRP